MFYFIFILMKSIVLIIGLLISIAYLTLVERHILSSIQRRIGPNIVGFFGLLQPLADGLKLLLKEVIIPTNANKFLFIFAPILMFVLSVVNWIFIPFSNYSYFVDIPYGLLFLFAFSSLGIYGILISGWSSNSKYAFLGSLRAAAQMISYEVSIGLLLTNVILCVGSLNFIEIVKAQSDIWYVIPLFPVSAMFYISILAETNRPPFDLPEAEAELVAGYNVEYSSITFALFFLGEYSNIILMSSLYVILFLGGFGLFYTSLTLDPICFILKILFIVLSFIWVRGAFPRYRYDQLMSLGWKVLLPLSLAFIFFNSGFLISINILPDIGAF